MAQKTDRFTFAAHHPVLLPSLDGKTEERVRQWVTRWHGADYEIDDISEMLEDWPASIALADLVEPFGTIDETESAVELSRLTLRLVRHVERGALETVHARGAFRLACRQLCTRGIPFEETAKGDETALWFHFICVNEFGDNDNQGYATDFAELRLMARYLISRETLLTDLLDGEFPRTFHEGYVSIAGALGDAALAPHLLVILRRCEDVQQVASVINVLGRLGDRSVVNELEGFALSTNEEIATTTVVALETLGGPDAERILATVQSVLPENDTPLAAHVAFARLATHAGFTVLREELFATAADRDAATVFRLAAIERLGTNTAPDTVLLLAGLLDDPTYERVSVDGYITDDVIHTIREAAYIALIDRRISALVQVLGEDILDRLESFQMYSMPSWWGSPGSDDSPLDILDSV